MSAKRTEGVFTNPREESIVVHHPATTRIQTGNPTSATQVADSNSSEGKNTMATKTKSKVAVRPLHDKILVERDEAQTQTSAGIYLPESASEKPQFATVLAVGNGTMSDSGTRIPLDVKVGDRIILSKWGGTELKLDGEDYLIINSSDVLAIVD